jgi:hypothetical protein
VAPLARTKKDETNCIQHKTTFDFCHVSQARSCSGLELGGTDNSWVGFRPAMTGLAGCRIVPHGGAKKQHGEETLRRRGWPFNRPRNEVPNRLRRSAPSRFNTAGGLPAASQSSNNRRAKRSQRVDCNLVGSEDSPTCYVGRSEIESLSGRYPPVGGACRASRK